jgi:hypothetical protein
LSRNRKTTFILVFLVILLALPLTAFARKQTFKARLTTGAELHEVVGSNATGSLVLMRHAGGLEFQMSVRGLSGTPTGAHLHAPATESENAGVILTLCGNPTPGVVATCTLDENGLLIISGSIPSTLLRGVTAAQFFSWLESGLVYVNVHTALNPAGETRGQLYPQ